MKSRNAAAAALLVVAAGAYAATLFSNMSCAPGGPDTSGYLNVAKTVAERRTRVVIEPLRTFGLSESFLPMFAPLGFTWGPPGTGTVVPYYPPGLPLHLAAAALIGGWDVGPCLVSPLAALGCLTLMVVVGRQFGLPWWLAAVGATVLAVLPHFFSHAIQPVSDVVATFWALSSMSLALVALRRPAAAIAAGAAFAIGVWVRPTNVLMAFPLVIAFRFRPALLARFVAGGLPFAAALMAYHARVYGHPLRTGYGSFLDVVSAHHFADSSRVLSRWMVTLCTPLVFPGGLLVAFDRRESPSTRVLLPVWFGVFFLLYCFWEPYDDFWSARFLLPGTPALIIGAMIVIRDLLQLPRTVFWRRTVATAAAAAVAVMVLMPLMQFPRYQVLNTDEGAAVYPDAVRFAERLMPANAIVISGALSGAFYYQSGRFTARFDQLDDDRFQLLRAYAGHHSLKWYAVIVEGEMYWDELSERLRGTWTPVGKYRHVTVWRLDS